MSEILRQHAKHRRRSPSYEPARHRVTAMVVATLMSVASMLVLVIWPATLEIVPSEDPSAALAAKRHDPSDNAARPAS